MRRNWSQEEDMILGEIVDQVGDNDWSTVAKYLQHRCDVGKGTKRTGKQCRERWYNQLSPSINKNQWTDEEQMKLFEVQKVYGNKWKEISKLLPGRTDNDIKNKFYSTLRRSLRRLNKVIGRKNSTGEIRQIKPSVLGSIINYAYAHQNTQNQQTEALKNIPSLIFKFSNFKPVRKNMNHHLEHQLKDNIDLIFRLLQQFKELQKITKISHQNHENNLNEIEQEKEESEEEFEHEGYEPKARIISPIIISYPPQGLYLHQSYRKIDEQISPIKNEQSSELEGEITIIGYKIQLPKAQTQERLQQAI